MPTFGNQEFTNRGVFIFKIRQQRPLSCLHSWSRSWKMSARDSRKSTKNRAAKFHSRSRIERRSHRRTNRTSSWLAKRVSQQVKARLYIFPILSLLHIYAWFLTATIRFPRCCYEFYFIPFFCSLKNTDCFLWKSYITASYSENS